MNLKKIGLLIIISIFYIANVKAATLTDFTYYDKELENFKITTKTFKCTSGRMSNDYLKPGGKLNTKYSVTLDGTMKGMLVCLSPSKPHGYSYTIESQVDIDSPVAQSSQKKAYYAAMIKAYQEMMSKDYVRQESRSSSRNFSDKSRQLATLLYRWIASYYGYLDTDYAYGGVSRDNYVKFTYSKRNDWSSKNWFDSDNKGIATIGREILANAIRVGNKIKNGKTVEELFDSGELWDINFDIAAEVLDDSDKSKVKIQLDIKPKGANSLTTLNYNNFRAECSNGFVCSSFRATEDLGRYGKRFILVVDSRKGNATAAEKEGKPYGISIKTNYNDIRDNAYLYDMKASSSVQQMIMFLYYDSKMQIISTVIPRWEDKCYCQVNNRGNLTRRYEYKKYTANKVITGTIDLADTKKAKEYNCPPAEECGLKTVCKCDYNDQKEFTNKYIVTFRSADSSWTERFYTRNTVKAEKYNCPDVNTCVKATCSCEFKDNAFTGNFVVKEKVNGATKQTIIPATDKENAKKYGCPDANSCSDCSCETDNKGNFTGNYLYYKNGALFETFKIDDQAKATKYGCPSADECANDCFCQVDGNNEYTEKYQYNKYENGQLITEIFDFDDPRAQQYNCPSSKKCHPKKRECSFDEDNDLYYGQNGAEVTKQEYISQCVKSCRTESDGAGGTKYYCSSDDPLISGRECNEEDYEEDCVCGPIKERCDNGDNSACDEYQSKCVTMPKSCSAKVTIPDECADFDTDLDSSTLQGEVDDLNKDPSCGNDTVKKCIIDGVDEAGNSYEMMSNSYCSVWCKESYKFDLPTARHSRSGGYFTLEAAVSGERECYATGNDNPAGPIDEAKFHKDLEDTEEELQKAYNNYTEAKEDKEYAEQLLENLKAQLPSAEAAVSSAQSSLWSAQSQLSSAESVLSSAESALSSAETRLADAQNALNSVPEGDEAGKASAEANVVSAEADVANAQRDVSNASSSVSSAQSAVSSAESDLSSAESYLSNLKYRISSTEDRIESDQQKMAENEALMNNLNNKIPSLFEEYNSCVSWGVDFKFDPKIDYWYNERYMDILTNENSGTFEADGLTSWGGMEEYCKGDTNDDFECQSDKSSRVQEKDQMYKYCTIAGCENRTRKLSDVLWIRKNETAANSYRPHANFSTSIGFGTIKRNAPECNGRDCLFTKLPINALPVELSTGRGVFPFVLQFRNIGQYNKTGEMGRLMGATKSVVTSLSKADSMCSTPGYHATSNASYVCQYINDCSDCETQCINCGDEPYEPEDPYEPPNIPDTECEGETCPLTCVSCIYDGDKTQYTFRTVSVNNVFPNSCNKAISNCRAEGYNWDTNNPKAKKTLAEIEEKAEEIYQEPEYSYTLNPVQLQSIRNYNEKAGSYLNTTIPETGETALKCDKLDINGKLYNVKCTSSFLDTDSQTYFSEQKRNTVFTLWDTKDINEYTGIGPSWK